MRLRWAPRPVRQAILDGIMQATPLQDRFLIGMNQCLDRDYLRRMIKKDAG